MKKSAKLTYIFNQVLMSIVLALNVISIFFNKDTSARSVYIFNVIQCVLFLIIATVGNKIVKNSSLKIPSWLFIVLLLYALAHFLFGEIFNFYAKISWWDSFLHTFSGVLISFLSISLITILNDTSNKKDLQLNILFTCIFALSISISIGVIWEFIEFASDSFFGTNMQRAYESTINGNSQGVPLVGQAALADTMKDLMLDTLGSLVTCILCAIFCKKKQISIEQLSVIKIQNKNENNLSLIENKPTTSDLTINQTNVDENLIETNNENNETSNEENSTNLNDYLSKNNN